MAIVGRILMVIIAYVLACIAASLVLTIGTLAPQWDQIAPPDVPSVVLWSVVGVSTAVIAIVAMLPSFLVIALAEGFAWRSVVLYGVLGGVLALALTYGIDFAGYARDLGPGLNSTFTHEREVLAASGIAGGLVYWVFAGRKAGLWKL
jgi:putative copper export protein